jgi:hypothetical protein
MGIANPTKSSAARAMTAKEIVTIMIFLYQSDAT